MRHCLSSFRASRHLFVRLLDYLLGHLLVLDRRMPEVDGIEVIRRIRANAAIAGETGGRPVANGYFHGKAGAAFEDVAAGQTGAA